MNQIALGIDYQISLPDPLAYYPCWRFDWDSHSERPIVDCFELLEPTGEFMTSGYRIAFCY